MGEVRIDKKYYSALSDNYELVNMYNYTGAQLSNLSKLSKTFMENLVSFNGTEDNIKSDLNDVRKNALLYFSIFNDKDIINRVIEDLNKVEYYTHTDNDYSLFYVYANIIASKTGCFKEPTQMFVPDDMRFSSSVFMVHEITHMLKERNPKECQEFSYFGEVIPMLMELIISYSFEYDKVVDVFNKRSNFIRCSSQSFDELYQTYKFLTDKDEIRVYKAALNESGTYVSSFYYTLVLFALFLQNKDLVLDLIKKVLRCECSTGDIIKYIGKFDLRSLYNYGLEEFNYSLK